MVDIFPSIYDTKNMNIYCLSSHAKATNLDTFRFTQNSIDTRTKLFPETKLSQQADIGFDDYTLLHCVWK